MKNVKYTFIYVAERIRMIDVTMDFDIIMADGGVVVAITSAV